MDDLRLPSNRSFGMLFTVVFAILGAWLAWRGRDAAPYLFGVGAAFAFVTWLRAQWLTPLNRAWMRLAQVLNVIVSPIVLGVMYYGVITPFGLVMRAAGRDPMFRRYDRQAPSYWKPRTPPGPPPESLRDQF